MKMEIELAQRLNMTDFKLMEIVKSNVLDSLNESNVCEWLCRDKYGRKRMRPQGAEDAIKALRDAGRYELIEFIYTKFPHLKKSTWSN